MPAPPDLTDAELVRRRAAQHKLSDRAKALSLIDIDGTQIALAEMIAACEGK